MASAARTGVGENDQQLLPILWSQPILQPVKASLNGRHGCAFSGHE
jgi:hypothetical protein